MRKEFIILIVFVIAVIFMTINDSNLENVENQKTLDSLKKKMFKYARELQFEKAALLRDQLEKIKNNYN